MNWFPFTYILDNLINSIHTWLTKDYRSSAMDSALSTRQPQYTDSDATLYLLHCLLSDCSKNIYVVGGFWMFADSLARNSIPNKLQTIAIGTKSDPKKH